MKVNLLKSTASSFFINANSIGQEKVVNFENIIGTAYADNIIGNKYENLIDGAGGNDLIYGGKGVDTVKYMTALAGITVNLVKGVSMSTAGSDAAGTGTDKLKGIENIIAGNFDDIIVGNKSANFIAVGAGNDTLDGGLGMDTLVGSEGADVFVFSTKLGAANVDTITDFISGVDKIELSPLVFAKLASGSIAGNFVSNASGIAEDSDDYLIFNITNQMLYYDADGNGAGTAVAFTALAGVSALLYTDFSIVA